MDTLLFDGQLRFVTDYLEPAQQSGETLVRPHLIGICNTDNIADEVAVCTGPPTPALEIIEQAHIRVLLEV